VQQRARRARGSNEQDRAALADHLVAEAMAGCELPTPAVREAEQHRLAVGDEVGGRQLADLAGAERGLGREARYSISAARVMDEGGDKSVLVAR
jgi:hypothetical protein